MMYCNQEASSFHFSYCLAKDRHKVHNLDIHVYFTPSAIVTRETRPDDIFIVIDVIRATTTLAVIFERGAERVFVAGSIEQARMAASLHPGRLLCGERNVKPLPGFDYGNSPVQFSQLDLTGRALILTTTNGTRAFYACPTGTTRLAGSFYNAHAIVAHTLRLATERASNISIVCSGELDYFALDDVVCAGYLVQTLQQQIAQTPQASTDSSSSRERIGCYRPLRGIQTTQAHQVCPFRAKRHRSGPPRRYRFLSANQPEWQYPDGGRARGGDGFVGVGRYQVKQSWRIALKKDRA